MFSTLRAKNSLSEEKRVDILSSPINNLQLQLTSVQLAFQQLFTAVVLVGVVVGVQKKNAVFLQLSSTVMCCVVLKKLQHETQSMMKKPFKNLHSMTTTN